MSRIRDNVGLLPSSRNQINKLGDRLRDAVTPADADLDALQQLLAVYDQALSSVRDTLDSLGFAPTIRLKTTATLIDKLRRDRRSNLSNVQDLAGARVVIEGGHSVQDQAVALISRSFPSEGPTPRITDRRVEPSFGYRAVHVVVHIGQIPVEVQIRTELQDSWAQIFERLADIWGRNIRYSDELDSTGLSKQELFRRREVLSLMMIVSSGIADFEVAQAGYAEWPLPDGLPTVDDVGGLHEAIEARRHVGLLVELEQTVKRVLAWIAEALDREVGIR